ncbi:hypothetical protein [Streptomyces sp. NPDC046821]|uniref:hypothetical protein n=1 Tax=Streptomyces sp. NPDC046821 TaxID=3154702 RepID=UPI00340C7CA3
MGWRSLDGERRVVTDAMRRGDHAIAQGRWSLALRHYGRANHFAVKVARAADGDQDRAVLGSVYYNLAELHTKDGGLAPAWLCALQACAVYAPLDPSGARPGDVASLVSSAGSSLAEERIGLCADARSRYVLLSAGVVRQFGPQALGANVADGALDGITNVFRVVDTIGEPAVRTFEELVRHGHRYTEADVDRTRRRVAQARELIGA